MELGAYRPRLDAWERQLGLTVEPDKAASADTTPAEEASEGMQRHEVPTHLNIEDKAFAGLTMRQLMVAIIGLALAYAAMSEAPLPLPVRLGLGAVVLLWTAAFTLWQPAGRSLEDWAFVLLRYASVPRVVVWRVRSPRLAECNESGRVEIVLPAQVDGERRGER